MPPLTKVNAIIPACPGYFVVYPIWHPADATRIEYLYYEPVIAWAVTTEYMDGCDPYTGTTPVCVDSECVHTMHLIQYPDGNLIDQKNLKTLLDLPEKSSLCYEDRIRKYFLDLKKMNKTEMLRG